MDHKRSEPCSNRYTIIWEFHVRPGSETHFEQVYGPDGDWVRLFRQDEGYIQTELLRDRKNPGRYLTVDHWVSRSAYERFWEQRVDDYKRLDGDCAHLTEREGQMGSYEVIGRR
jgi:heme-degrading monooxygenase HmoA